MADEDTVRIRLTQNLPVNSKHGATKGREFDAVRENAEGRSRVHWWIHGDDGDQVGVFFHEAEEVEAGTEATGD